MNNQDITEESSLREEERVTLLAKAMASVREAIPQAEEDDTRPTFHFHTPAYWMNDPNGPIFHNGWFHIFYQHNPYGDGWGHMHWGHARSQDMVHWEHLPIALWPTRSKGEDHIYSGSTFPDAQGKPVIFYTSISEQREPEQWAAMPEDDDLIVWHKYPANPVLNLAAHGDMAVREWRDPFVFQEGTDTYMVVGGGANGKGVVLLYQAESGDLVHWKYVGILFTYPGDSISNIECPNIARIGDRWVLLISTYDKGLKVESFTGTLDLPAGTFTAEKRSVLGEGSYASQLVTDPKGRCIEWAWVQPPHGAGWAGCLTLPSVLSITSDGTLLRRPLPELATLRERSLHREQLALTGALDLTELISGDALELVLEIAPGAATAVGVRLRVSPEGERKAEIRYETQTRLLSMPGREPVTIPMLPKSDILQLHLFLDKTVLDVYVGDGQVTQIVKLEGFQSKDLGVHVFAEGSDATIRSLEVYSMKPAAFHFDAFL